jgi:hypothetical protein
MPESTKEKRIWHSGPPPHVGWWNASTELYPHYWRWWTGTAWSCRALAGSLPQHAGINAMGIEGALHQKAMMWCDFWPEGARVPRIDPGSAV